VLREHGNCVLASLSANIADAGVALDAAISDLGANETLVTDTQRASVAPQD
jgi:hypothetical protein